MKKAVLIVLFAIMILSSVNALTTNMTQGLVSCYNANNNASDYLLNNNGTLLNSAIINTTDKKLGAGSFQIAHSNSVVNLTNNFGFTTANLSISLWFNFRNNISGEFFHIGGASNGVGLGLSTSGTSFDFTGNKIQAIYNGVAWVATGVQVNGTGWHHLVMTINNTGNSDYYLDGVLVYSKTGSIINSAGSYMNFGPLIGTFNGYNGQIDEIKIWRIPINQSQVTDDYNAGTGLTCSDLYTSSSDTTPPGPITNLGVFSKNNQSLFINWTNPADADYNKSELWDNGVNSINISQPTAFYNLTGLGNNTQHYIILIPIDATGNHGTNVSITNTTSQNGPNFVTAPLNALAISYDNQSILVNWTNSVDAAKWIIRVNGNNTQNATSRPINLTIGIYPNTLYWINLTGYNSSVLIPESASSNTFAITTSSNIAYTPTTTTPPSSGGSGGGVVISTPVTQIVDCDLQITDPKSRQINMLIKDINEKIATPFTICSNVSRPLIYQFTMDDTINAECMFKQDSSLIAVNSCYTQFITCTMPKSNLQGKIYVVRSSFSDGSTVYPECKSSIKVGLYKQDVWYMLKSILGDNYDTVVYGAPILLILLALSLWVISK